MNARFQPTIFIAALAILCNPGLLKSKARNPHVCKLPRSNVTCVTSGYTYFFNDATKQCIRLKYGTCNGNQNHFHSREVCKKTCLNSILRTGAKNMTGTSERSHLRM